MICQHCQTSHPFGTLLCNQCFMPLESPPAPAQLVGGGPKKPTVRWVLIENLLPVGPCLELPELGYEGEILLGRHDLGNQVIVDIDLSGLGGFERKISRKHAKLHFKQGQLWLEDWESRYGIYVNKQKLSPQQPHLIQAGDEIRLAEMTFRMEVN